MERLDRFSRSAGITIMVAFGLGEARPLQTSGTNEAVFEDRMTWLAASLSKALPVSLFRSLVFTAVTTRNRQVFRKTHSFR